MTNQAEIPGNGDDDDDAELNWTGQSWPHVLVGSIVFISKVHSNSETLVLIPTVLNNYTSPNNTSTKERGKRKKFLQIRSIKATCGGEKRKKQWWRRIQTITTGLLFCLNQAIAIGHPCCCRCDWRC